MACEAGYENSSTALDLHTSNGRGPVGACSMLQSPEIGLCELSLILRLHSRAKLKVLTICLLLQVLQCIFPFHSSC